VIARNLLEAVSFAVAITFSASALAKLRDPAGFVLGVNRYGVLPARMAGPTAALVIALELLVAAAFATGFLLRWAAVAALVLLSGFAVGVAVNLRRGRDFPCLCFGTRSEDRISKWSLARIGLLGCGALVVVARPPVSATSLYGSHGETAQEIFLALTLAVGIVALARWLLVAPALLNLHRAGVSHR
jgi:Methylamine utilisation protein MauE